MADKKQLPGLITGLVALVAVAVFMILGFTTGLWHIVWLVFLVIPITGIITDMIAKRNERLGMLVGIVSILAVLVFLALGFFARLWHPGWLVFLAIPLTAVIVDLITKQKGKTDAFIGVIAILAAITFLLLGFFAGLWDIAWIVFLLIPISAIIMQIVKAVKGEADGQNQGEPMEPRE